MRRDTAQPDGRNGMKYVSTRGEAPVLGFSDAVLAGLARDGGLYVPQEWPRFSAADIRAMRGLAYPELAVRLLTPFLGGEISPAVFERLAHEAYATFRHEAVCPMVQTRREYLRPGALPRPDARLQGRGDATARPADGPCARRARPARDHRRRDFGRHRRRGDRGFRRTRPHRHLHPVSAWQGVAGAAAPDDHVEARRTCMRWPSKAISTTARAW